MAVTVMRESRIKLQEEKASPGFLHYQLQILDLNTVDAVAIPPPSKLSDQSVPKNDEKTGVCVFVYMCWLNLLLSVVLSALEELSRKKAQKKANPFAKPKL